MCELCVRIMWVKTLCRNGALNMQKVKGFYVILHALGQIVCCRLACAKYSSTRWNSNIVMGFVLVIVREELLGVFDTLLLWSIINW